MRKHSVIAVCMNVVVIYVLLTSNDIIHVCVSVMKSLCNNFKPVVCYVLNEI